MRWSLNAGITVGFGAALIMLAVSELISYRSTGRLVQASRQLTHSQRVLESLEKILVTIDDAETGQRGYLLTGKKSYLEPYESAKGQLPRRLATLGELTSDLTSRQRNLVTLRGLIKRKQRELAETIALRKTNKIAAATRIITSDQGKKEMDDIRTLIAGMKASEKARMAARSALWAASSLRTTRVVAFGVGIAFIFLLAAILALNSEASERVRAERELQKSRARARMLTDSILDYAILMLDPEGKVLSWSPGATKILGYKEEEILGQSFSSFFPPHDVAAGVPHQELERVLVNGRAESEGWRVRKDGSRFWANAVMVAVRDDKGQLQGFSKVIRDITEHKASQEEIEELNGNLERRASELEASNKELEAFTYSVSHDLRAPLRHIDGFSQLLVDEYAEQLPEEARAILIASKTGPARWAPLSTNC